MYEGSNVSGGSAARQRSDGAVRRHPVTAAGAET